MSNGSGRLHTHSINNSFSRFKSYEDALELGKEQKLAETMRFLNQIDTIIEEMTEIAKFSLTEEFHDTTQKIESCSLLFLLSQFFRLGILKANGLTKEYILRFTDIPSFGFTRAIMEETLSELESKGVIVAQQNVLQINGEWLNKIFIIPEG